MNGHGRKRKRPDIGDWVGRRRKGIGREEVEGSGEGRRRIQKLTVKCKGKC